MAIGDYVATEAEGTGQRNDTARDVDKDACI